MRILVTAATRHGATAEIAEAIAGTLLAAGHDVDVHRPEEVASFAEFDAVVLGSAVYYGRWLPAARRFVERLDEELTQRPVWLFSTGPIGDPAKPDGDPAEVAALVARTHARGHKTFAGRLSPSTLSLTERLAIQMVRATPGDFRPWDEIRAWTAEIAEALEPKVTVMA
jgi:menaquinone-dependent protoporphyrinogen oxidase